MPLIRSNDYHDFVIKDGEFIGEFEQMYQQVGDPWGCGGQAGVLKNDLLVTLAGHVGGHKVLDIGCGLGTLTNRLQNALPAAEWYACDISPTAAAKAARDNPAVHFLALDVCKSDFPFMPGSFDLIIMSEVLWYILPFLDTVLARIRELLSKDSNFLVMQYFLAPEEQKYGNGIVAGPRDFTMFLERAGFKLEREIFLGAVPPNDVLFWSRS